ncbi:pyridoxal phosphate-dependent decarboxylase family protein [Umezawaea endophytica]|uniref:Aminotransferase class V-fold PLP-dependent enzyme n=1 Tax=Umezawaea endophytica TaxID=1654476 RepID=A0A9X2VTG0_9PSEU|nr:aminotransferase class V-fold PLP-dependent enzyme [Umezawaea endophytica]MCS7481824.1 aminotransferase class V-fold PLP-dependent enzyme [Umezawaea endophytica]
MLEPDRETRREWTDAVGAFVEDFVAGLAKAPASEPAPADLTEFLAEPPERPGTFDDLLATFGRAAGYAVETAGPGYLGYFPAGGLLSSVLAETLAQAVNRFTGVADTAPALVAMEHAVIRWFCRRFDLPDGAGGVITSGASLATLAALTTAREDRLGGPDPLGTIYVTEHTHYCVAKAARIAGFTSAQVRVVPVDDDLRMDLAAAEALIADDRDRGLRPFFLVGTAGSTSTGTVDPLDALGALAAREDLWFHVDGAYGGSFQLTDRGRAILHGVHRADSITLDPHKSLFLPYGTGLLLVRDEARLRAAHAADGHYLQDLDREHDLPDYGDLGPELTREYRGLRLWLPLHLHGVAAFRAELDEKLDLAALVHRELSAEGNLEVPLVPDLTVTVFRSPFGDATTERLLERINGTRRIFLSSTRLDGKHTLRLCVLSHRTHRAHVEEALDIVRRAARES